MSISIRRYVDITSGVGAGQAVPTRNFGLRIISQNLLIPAGHVIEMDSADEVGSYFGTASQEYKMAAEYFGFVSKLITRPKQISFVLWNAASIPAMIFGGSVNNTVAQLKLITAGELTIDVGGVPQAISGLNFSSITAYADAATIIKTALNAISGNPSLVTANVQYSANQNQFIVTGGVLGGAAPSLHIVANSTDPDDVAQELGFASSSVIETAGQAASTPIDVMINSSGEDDNFGSFAFVRDTDGSLLPTLDQVTELATWNKTQNVKYMFLVGVTPDDASAWSTALAGIGGIGMTLVAPNSGTYNELIPGENLAATDWSRPNASGNYMYLPNSLDKAPVSTDALADSYDALRINYVGQTQTAGQKIMFYQRGFLGGGATDPVDMAVYAGEQWLKDDITVAMLRMMLNLPNIPATEIGRTTALSNIQPSIQKALVNGVIAVGKALDQIQKSYIDQLTGVANSWRQVESKGYWINATIQSYVENGVTQYKVVYLLIYSKNDQIRKVEGSDVLI